MDGHELDGIFWSPQEVLLQNRVHFRSTLSIMAMKRDKPFKAGFLIIIGPKRQGMRDWPGAGPHWKGADIVIVIAILMDFPQQIIERRGLGSSSQVDKTRGKFSILAEELGINQICMLCSFSRANWTHW